MMDNKKVSIARNGNKNEYQIKTLKAWDWFNLTADILICITDTEAFKAKNLKAALNTIAGTGITDDSVKNNEMIKVIDDLKTGQIDFIIDLAISVINGLTEERRNIIVSKLLSCVYFNNGNPNFGGGLIQLNLDNLDMYTSHPLDLITLIKESFIVNYKYIYDDFFKVAPSTK